MSDKGGAAQSKGKQEDSTQSTVPSMCLKCKMYIPVFEKLLEAYVKKWNELIWHTGLTEKTVNSKQSVQHDWGSCGIPMDLLPPPEGSTVLGEN